MVLALAAVPAWATTYPVGASRAYKTPCLLVASVVLQPGDIVEVNPGTYTDACQLTASGTAAKPITLRGVPGPRPLFDATGSISRAQARSRARSSSSPVAATGASSIWS